MTQPFIPSQAYLVSALICELANQDVSSITLAQAAAIVAAADLVVAAFDPASATATTPTPTPTPKGA